MKVGFLPLNLIRDGSFAVRPLFLCFGKMFKPATPNKNGYFNQS